MCKLTIINIFRIIILRNKEALFTTTIRLHVPRKGDCTGELQRLLPVAHADIHVFPEEFLTAQMLTDALQSIREADAFVIAGYLDTASSAPMQKALVIHRGTIISEVQNAC